MAFTFDNKLGLTSPPLLCSERPGEMRGCCSPHSPPFLFCQLRKITFFFVFQRLLNDSICRIRRNFSIFISFLHCFLDFSNLFFFFIQSHNLKNVNHANSKLSRLSLSHGMEEEISSPHLSQHCFVKEFQHERPLNHTYGSVNVDRQMAATE